MPDRLRHWALLDDQHCRMVLVAPRVLASHFTLLVGASLCLFRPPVPFV